MSTISLDQKLYSPDSLVLKKLGDFYAVLNGDGPNIVVVDESGKDFFGLCNGTYKLREIAERIHERHPSEDTSTDKIMEFSRSLINSGFITTKPPDPLKKEVGLPERLSQIYLHLTHKCNLDCKHCYISAGRPLPDEMTSKEILNLIEEFRRLGGNRLILTGGETFLRREPLYQAVRKARDLGIQDVKIETNGTLITDKDIRLLKDSEASVAVSLGGATPRSHSYVRGKGTFLKVIKTVRKLAESNVNTTIGITLMRPNLGEGRKIAHLAKDLGVNLVTLNMITFMGRAKEHEELAISPTEAMSAVKEVRQAAEELGVKTVFEEILTSLRHLGRRESCGAGVNSLSIAANGDLYPCNSFQDGPLRAGNVREQTLEEIWRKSSVCQTFQNLSVLDIHECRGCELKFICSGGCLAETFRTFQDLRVRSPYCSVYKEIYWNLIAELAHELWNET